MIEDLPSAADHGSLEKEMFRSIDKMIRDARKNMFAAVGFAIGIDLERCSGELKEELFEKLIIEYGMDPRSVELIGLGPKMNFDEENEERFGEDEWGLDRE